MKNVKGYLIHQEFPKMLYHVRNAKNSFAENVFLLHILEKIVMIQKLRTSKRLWVIDNAIDAEC